MRSLAILFFLLLGTAHAQTDLATYTAADREQRLMAGAKKEGELAMYTSAQTDDMGVLAKAFQAKYGVKVSLWRAGSEAILQRVMTEARGGRYLVDVIETDGPELEALHREGLLQPVKSPHLADIIAAAKPAHGEWVGTRLNIFAFAYNTRAVRKDELPKTYEDLAHPRWKGRLGIESEDTEWLAGVLAQTGEQRGIQLFREIVQKNGISVRRGHTLLAQLVASGEVPLALTVYNYKAEQLKRKGAPIDWFAIGKAVARPNGIGIPKRLAHPNAAILFYDFELSEEGQRILAGRDIVPTNRKVATALNQVPTLIVDPKVMIDEQEKWGKLYEELFLRQR